MALLNSRSLCLFPVYTSLGTRATEWYMGHRGPQSGPQIATFLPRSPTQWRHLFTQESYNKHIYSFTHWDEPKADLKCLYLQITTYIYWISLSCVCSELQWVGDILPPSIHCLFLLLARLHIKLHYAVLCFTKSYKARKGRLSVYLSVRFQLFKKAELI